MNTIFPYSGYNLRQLKRVARNTKCSEVLSDIEAEVNSRDGTLDEYINTYGRYNFILLEKILLKIKGRKLDKLFYYTRKKSLRLCKSTN